MRLKKNTSSAGSKLKHFLILKNKTSATKNISFVFRIFMDRRHNKSLQRQRIDGIRYNCWYHKEIIIGIACHGTLTWYCPQFSIVYVSLTCRYDRNLHVCELSSDSDETAIHVSVHIFRAESDKIYVEIE